MSAEKNLNERLIAEVSHHEYLYNPSSLKQKGASEREPAWAKVAAAMNTTVDDCKQRWRVLRDTFVRNHKKMKEGTGPKHWKLSKEMAFIAPYIRKRKEFGDSAEDSVSVEEIDQDRISQDSDLYHRLDTDAHGTAQGPFVFETASPNGSQGDYQAYEHLRGCLQTPPHVMVPIQPRDEAELYLLSLAPAYRRLSDRNKARARIQIETIMADLEFGSGGEGQGDVTMRQESSN